MNLFTLRSDASIKMLSLLALASLILALLPVGVMSSFAATDGVTGIQITSDAQTIEAGAISGGINVQTINSTSSAETVSETSTFTLTSTSATGEFSSNSNFTSTTSNITVSINTANRNFWYRDSSVGTHALTVDASSQGWGIITQDIEVTAPVVDPVQNTDTGEFFLTIQAAIDDNETDAGDTIVVAAGTYTENIDVDKELTLEGNDLSTIDGQITVNAENVTINEFTLTNPTGVKAVLVNGVGNVNVTNNSFTQVGSDSSVSSNVHAFWYQDGASSVSNINVSDNTFDTIGHDMGRSATAIGVGDSTGTAHVNGVTIIDNIITNVVSRHDVNYAGGGRGAYGILINHARSSDGGTTADVEISGNDIGLLEGLWVHAIGLEGSTPNALITDNNISDVTEHKLVLEGTLDGVGIFFEDNDYADTVTISQNNFYTDGSWLGIAVHPAMVGTYDVDTEENYWNTTDETTIQARMYSPAGIGIDYNPWLCEAAPSTETTTTGFCGPKTEETIVITSDTSTGENQPGWMFNRDLETKTPFVFNTIGASIGTGALYVEPIANIYPVSTKEGNDKFIAEYFPVDGAMLTSDFESFSFDFQIGDGGTNADANEYYLSVYTNLTGFYDCSYNFVPTTGTVGSFTTFIAASDDVTSVAARNPATCPSKIEDLPNGSTIRVFAINLGDISMSDTGLDGFFDNVVLTTFDKITTFDFEPVEPEPVVEEEQPRSSGGSRRVQQAPAAPAPTPVPQVLGASISQGGPSPQQVATFLTVISEILAGIQEGSDGGDLSPEEASGFIEQLNQLILVLLGMTQ